MMTIPPIDQEWGCSPKYHFSGFKHITDDMSAFRDENGKIRTSPVSDAYWDICECKPCIEDRTNYIAEKAAEEILSEKDCHCGSGCMSCLGMSWRDFL